MPLLYTIFSHKSRCYTRFQDLTALAHLRYHLFTHLTNKTALVPATKIVVKQQLLIFRTVAADNILVHNVRNEILRQSFGVNYFFTRFLQVFDEIRYGAAEFAFIVQRLEIAPPEALVKICVLVRCLPPVRLETVILLLYNRAGHRSVRNLKQAVKVETLLFGTSLPYADIFPIFTVT